VIYGSSDGTTWTQKVSGATEELYEIAYGNNTFVVVGSGVILTSTDGTTWTKHSTSLGLKDVIYIE
jgi:hypothetical protein